MRGCCKPYTLYVSGSFCNYLASGHYHHRAHLCRGIYALGSPACLHCEIMPTLRSGRAGRPTKGALRGADARVTGTACWALASGLRMIIAGAAMVSMCDNQAGAAAR